MRLLLDHEDIVSAINEYLGRKKTAFFKTELEYDAVNEEVYAFITIKKDDLKNGG